MIGLHLRMLFMSWNYLPIWCCPETMHYFNCSVFFYPSHCMLLNFYAGRPVPQAAARSAPACSPTPQPDTIPFKHLAGFSRILRFQNVAFYCTLTFFFWFRISISFNISFFDVVFMQLTKLLLEPLFRVVVVVDQCLEPYGRVCGKEIACLGWYMFLAWYWYIWFGSRKNSEPFIRFLAFYRCG